MRLILCLLLVILAVCCYEANAARVCEAVKRESFTFLLKTEEELREELERYGAPPEAVEAKLEVKRYVDSKLGDENTVIIASVLGQVLGYCFQH